MARKSPEQAEIEQLIRQSDEARQQLGGRITLIRQRLGFPKRVLGSMRGRGKTLLFGSMAAGFLTSLLLRRSAGNGRRKTFRARLLGLTLTAAKPLAKVWITGLLRKRGEQWLTARFRKGDPPKPSPFQIEPSPYTQDVRTPGS